MKQYVKKPIVIEAVQLTDGPYGNHHEVEEWCGGEIRNNFNELVIDIHTLEGTMVAEVGDWIIKGIQGEFYPCKPDIFAATYDEVAEEYIPRPDIESIDYFSGPNMITTDPVTEIERGRSK
jgi:hypothetical protein